MHFVSSFFQKLYYSYSKFLPFINNERESTNSTAFKNGISKLNKIVLIGGPDDGVITPWQSSQFGYYDANGTVVLMQDRDIYTNDKIGLKTLDKQKKLVTHSVPGILHDQWHKNVTIVDNYILPYLD